MCRQSHLLPPGPQRFMASLPLVSVSQVGLCCFHAHLNRWNELLSGFFIPREVKLIHIHAHIYMFLNVYLFGGFGS